MMLTTMLVTIGKENDQPSPRRRTSPGRRPGGKPTLSTNQTTAPTTISTTPKIRIHLPIMLAGIIKKRQGPSCNQHWPYYPATCSEWASSHCIIAPMSRRSMDKIAECRFRGVLAVHQP